MATEATQELLRYAEYLRQGSKTPARHVSDLLLAALSEYTHGLERDLAVCTADLEAATAPGLVASPAPPEVAPPPVPFERPEVPILIDAHAAAALLNLKGTNPFSALNSMAKRGVLTPIARGKRVFYQQAEIEAMKKFYQYKGQEWQARWKAHRAVHLKHLFQEGQ